MPKILHVRKLIQGEVDANLKNVLGQSFEDGEQRRAALKRNRLCGTLLKLKRFHRLKTLHFAETFPPPLWNSPQASKGYSSKGGMPLPQPWRFLLRNHHFSLQKGQLPSNVVQPHQLERSPSLAYL